jgi:transcription elongation factor GreB
LARRLARLTVVDEAPADASRVAFGATVTVEHDDGSETTWCIVGPDEVELHEGGVSVTSPVARALLRRRVGDEVRLVRPRGAIEVTVSEVRYGGERGKEGA